MLSTISQDMEVLLIGIRFLCAKSDEDSKCLVNSRHLLVLAHVLKNSYPKIVDRRCSNVLFKHDEPLGKHT